MRWHILHILLVLALVGCEPAFASLFPNGSEFCCHSSGLAAHQIPNGSEFSEPVPVAAQRYRRALTRAARSDLGLDAPIATLAGQVHQESHWRPGVDSPAGAQGIAQFMPATAQWMAELYPEHLGDAQPYNPGWALRAMVRYDKWLLERVQARSPCDTWAMVLSAYNGGLGWVYKDRDLALASGASGLAWFHSNTGSDVGIERFNSGRSPANFEENRHYPRVILFRWAPRYVAAGWGFNVCGCAS